MQDQPVQSTLSMGNGSDNRLVVSLARDRAAVHDLEDASFGPGCGVRSLGRKKRTLRLTLVQFEHNSFWTLQKTPFLLVI